MKQIISTLLCLVFLFAGCAESKLTPVENSLFDPKQTLTPAETEIYNDLKEDLVKRMVENFDLADQTYYTSSQIEKMEMHTIPYYEFNEELFFENPSYERILTSCVPPENKVMFMGKLDGRPVAIFIAHKRRYWLVENLNKGPNFIKNTFAWIHEKIAYPDSSHCRLIKVYASTYLAYTEGDKTTYYNFYSGKDSSNGILGYIKFTNEAIKEYRESMKKEE